MNVKIIVDAKIHGGNPSIDLYSRHYNKLKYHTNPNTFLLKPGIQTLECDIDFYPVDCLYIKFKGKVHTVPDTFVKLNKVIIDEIDMQQFLLLSSIKSSLVTVTVGKFLKARFEVGGVLLGCWTPCQCC